MRSLIGTALCLVLASCGTGTNATNDTNRDSPGDTTLTKISLTSDAFQDGQPIPIQFTCDGTNQSPGLKWSDPPAGTKSFAVVVDDPDAPGGTFRHWGAYDIPASARSIAGGQHLGTEVANDMDKSGYAGPCPPRGNGVHHYHFRLFALDVDRLPLAKSAKVVDVENAAKQHMIAQAELIGTHERK